MTFIRSRAVLAPFNGIVSMDRFQITVLLAAMFLVSGSFCRAQIATASPGPPPSVQDAQAVAVMQQCLAAVGLTDAGLDSREQGTISFPNGDSASIVIKTRGTNKLRHEIAFSDKQLVYVVNNGSGYKLLNGNKEVLPLHVTLYQRPEEIPAFYRLTDFANPSSNARYIALENLSGNQIHHVQL